MLVLHQPTQQINEVANVHYFTKALRFGLN